MTAYAEKLLRDMALQDRFLVEKKKPRRLQRRQEEDTHNPHGIQRAGGRGFEVTRPPVAFKRSSMVRIFAIQVVATGI